MDLATLGLGLLIIVARIVDVSLGTLRTVCVIHGRRGLAWLLGFFEVLVWVTVVSKVITNLHEPILAVCYALGFATGNYLGLMIESWLAFGQQVVRVFTREPVRVAAALRSDGFRVTQFAGEGRDGPVHLLLTETPRRDVGRVATQALQLDPSCFYIVDDVRLSSSELVRLQQRYAGWWSILKRK